MMFTRPHVAIASALVCSIGLSTATAQTRPANDDAIDLRADSAHKLPHATATELCAIDTLRLVTWNDAEHVIVQAVLWQDDSTKEGETNDGRTIGDNSSLRIDVDANGEITPNVDRSYALNPWPHLAGLHYSIELGRGGSTGLRKNSKGHGAITYHTTPDGATVRVDTYVIPLAELDRAPGDTIRIAYHGSSTVPEMVVNSVGYEHDGKYYAFHLPIEQYHEMELASDAPTIDVTDVPRGRNATVAAAKPALKPKPTVGSTPPALRAKEWINTDGPVSLKSLRGEVVVVEFWATWCGPCVAGIPHLNELHEKYKDDGLHIVAFTDQSKRGISSFLDKTPMHYAIGTGSSLAREYGVTGIPHSFIVNRDGTVRWHGHPAMPAFDKEIIAALAEPKP